MAGQIIDVSHHQGAIDWNAVKAGPQTYAPVVAAYAKATEHTTFVDRRHGEFVAQARAVGFPIGSYHFARPDTVSGGSVDADARAEARHFAANARGLDLPPMLDLEVTKLGRDATRDWILSFLDEAEARFGRSLVIYTGAFTPFTSDARIAAQAPLWLARYTAGYAVDPNPAAIPQAPTRAPWPIWSLWQYTSSGRVRGIAGNVDRNVVRDSWLAAALGTTTGGPIVAALEGIDREMLERIHHFFSGLNLFAEVQHQGELTRAEVRARTGAALTDDQLEAIKVEVGRAAAEQIGVSVNALKSDLIDAIEALPGVSVDRETIVRVVDESLAPVRDALDGVPGDTADGLGAGDDDDDG